MGACLRGAGFIPLSGIVCGDGAAVPGWVALSVCLRGAGFVPLSGAACDGGAAVPGWVTLRACLSWAWRNSLLLRELNTD